MDDETKRAPRGEAPETEPAPSAADAQPAGAADTDTDSDLSRGRTDAETARLAYEGGADAVQLRMKHTDGGEMLAQAREIAAMAQEMGRFFFVNDRVDIAMASGADI